MPRKQSPTGATIKINDGELIHIDMSRDEFLKHYEEAVRLDQEHVLLPSPEAQDKLQVWIGHNAKVEVNGKLVSSSGPPNPDQDRE